MQTAKLRTSTPVKYWINLRIKILLTSRAMPAMATVIVLRACSVALESPPEVINLKPPIISMIKAAKPIRETAAWTTRTKTNSRSQMVGGWLPVGSVQPVGGAAETGLARAKVSAKVKVRVSSKSKQDEKLRRNFDK